MPLSPAKSRHEGNWLHFSIKCGADYLRCKCVKFIDEDVSENHIEYEQIGMTWTNRSAYYPEGELLLD